MDNVEEWNSHVVNGIPMPTHKMFVLQLEKTYPKTLDREKS